MAPLTNNIEIAKGYKELPSEIQKKLGQANIFFTETYENYVKRRDEHIYFLYNTQYIIPVKIRKIYFFKFATLISEYYCIDDQNVLPRSEKDFLDSLIKYVGTELHIMWLDCAASALFNEYPNRSKVIPFGSHIIDLRVSEEELWKNIHSKHKNVIRKAEKQGVTVCVGGQELLADYVLLDNNTSLRGKRSKRTFDYFQKILQSMNGSSVVYISYYEESPQAGAIFLMNSAMCYYMYGATADKPQTGSANLLMWRAITDMKQNGVRQFSFVGCRINEDADSKYHGIQRFKERFGGKLQKGFMFKVIYNKIAYKAFTLGMQLHSGDKLHPYKDIIDSEIHKWPELQISRE